MAILDIPDNKVLEIKERILLEIRYYDESDNVIQASDKAARIEVNIKNSTYLKSIHESYLDEKPFGEGDKTEISTDGEESIDIIYTTIIEKDKYNILSEILLMRLNTQVKSLILKVESQTDIVIKEEVIKYILSNFESIYFDLNGLTTWITFPEISTQIKNLIIESAQIYITQSIISCSSSFSMKNCILQSKPNVKNRPSLLVNIEEKAVLNDIKIADRLYFGISGSTVKNFDKWALTNITISDFTIGFKDINRNEKAHNGMYDSLLTITEVNDVSISGLTSINDIPYYSLLSIKDVNSINLSTIIRNSVELPSLSPTIKLANYINCNIYQIGYNGKNNSLEKCAFIKLLKTKLTGSLAISNANLVKMPLLNLVGINLQKISITDSIFINNDFILNMDSSYIGEFILNGVSIKNGKINISASSLCINSSTTINTEKDIDLNIKENSSIFESVIKSKGNINIKLSPDSSLNINKTTFEALKDLNIESEYTEDTHELTSSISLYTVNMIANNLIIQRLKTLNTNEFQWFLRNIKIIDCNYCSLKEVSIDPKAAIPISIDIINVNIRPSNVNIFNPLNYNLTLSKCKGDLHIAHLDDKNNSSKFMLKLIKSDIIVTLDAVSNRKIHLFSEESLGSMVYSESDTIAIIPDIESGDRHHFERITENKKDNKKILYGNLLKLA
jgi:hypothetical protein